MSRMLQVRISPRGVPDMTASRPVPTTARLAAQSVGVVFSPRRAALVSITARPRAARLKAYGQEIRSS